MTVNRRTRTQTTLALAALAALASAAHADTTGSLFLNWTDRVGNPHPLVTTQVALYDFNTVTGVQTLLQTSITDATGRLNLSTSFTRPDGSPLNVVADVKAIVTTAGTAGVDYSASPLLYRLPTSFSFLPNSAGTTYTPAPVDNSNDAGKAIGFLQGLKVAADYYRSLGANVSDVSVRFNSAWGNGSYMSGWNMNLGYDSWGAWDVAFHEFSHGIAYANHLDIQSELGFSHSFNQDNIKAGPALGAALGTQLAWQEGIATYMGTSALAAALPAHISNMPAADSNTWYDRYSSTATTTPDSSAAFNVDLENRTGIVPPTTYVIPGKGEGDELSVARILWDLRDNTPNEALPRPGRTDQISLGGQAVFNLMKTTGANNNARLSELWKAARTAYGTTPAARALLGDIFEANAVSAIPGAAPGLADGSSSLSLTPTLAWTPQNGGNSSLFEVAIYSQDFNTLLQTSPVLSNLTAWTLANPLPEGTYNWVIISNSAMQSSLSFDDSYWSGAASFIIVPEPTTLTLLALTTLTLLPRRRRH